jgi:DNA replication protein DnaC
MLKLEKVITTGLNDGKIPSPPNFLQNVSYKCDKCEDTGAVFGTYSDKDSGSPLSFMTECECVLEQKRKEILNEMPPLFITADIKTLTPLLEKHAKQKSISPVIKENPLDSYLFMGTSGVGKTYIAWALWKNAALSGRKAIATTAASLSEQYKEYEVNDSATRPKVLPRDLAQKHTKYTILLDEIEKMRISAFTLEKFFELLKNASDYEHQLLVTSNKSEDELKEYFSQVDEVWGSAIMRRLMDGTTIVRMWK